MSLILYATIAWIPVECGGTAGLPIEGLRPIIRFQRNLDEWSNVAWDVQITRIDAGTLGRTGNVELTFSKDAFPDMNYVKPGELIELLDAYRVIGVGKILDVKTE